MPRPLRLIHGLLLLVVQAAPAMAPADAPDPNTSGGITEIVLERTGCYGSCPVDTLVLRPNGKAEYAGKEYTRLSGEFAGVFPPRDFDRLAHWLVTEGFFQLRERDGVSVIDDSKEAIRVTRDGERKSVTSYSSVRSLQLWAMSNLIRSVTADIQWQPAHSGIRGQLLLKPAGEDWRPQPGDYIWVTAAGTQDRRGFNADHEGRFEINLAPGSYSVSSRMDLVTPQTIVVEPDRFTAVDFRLDVAARNAAIQYRPPPPPPGDGLYLTNGKTTKWMLSKGSEDYWLSGTEDLVILDKQLVSEGPGNSTFRLALTVPYDEKRRSLDLFSLFLLVGDSIYRPLGTLSGVKDNPVVYFQIPGQAQATEVGKFFGIPLSPFSRPDYKLSVSLVPTRQAFKRGETVTATLRIVNNGTDFINFDTGGIGEELDDYAFTARNSGQPVTDLSFPGGRGTITDLRFLAPKATYEDTVDLGKWFDFKAAGAYEIHGKYKMSIDDSRDARRRIGLMSWTEYAETDFVVTVE